VNSSGGAPAHAGNLLNDAYTATNQSYERYENHPLPRGWKDVTPSPNTETGKLFATAEASELVAPNGQHYVAFRGTQTASDVVEDINQGTGAGAAETNPKYNAAAKIGEAYRGRNVVFTGHSLGGGEAQLAAAVASERPTGDPLPRPGVCVTFNSAYPDPNTLREHGVNPSDVKTHLVEVVNTHDPLNRGIYGGKLTAMDGEAIKDREGKNDVVIVATGEGGYAGQGHKIGSIAGPDGNLTNNLYDDRGLHVNKADFDALTPGRDALANKQDVVTTLKMAETKELQVAKAGHDGR